MLSVGKVNPGNAGYYQSAVVAGVEDYYAGDGDAPGVWVGRADLKGAVAGSLATAVDSKIAGRIALPADYVEAGNVSVDSASTIHRAQGASVDEAHLFLTEHTDAKQLYVGATRGRTANHIHVARPSFDTEAHGPDRTDPDWTASAALVSALGRSGGATTALARRRELRQQAANTVPPIQRTRSHSGRSL